MDIKFHMEKVRLKLKEVLTIADGEDTSLIILVDEKDERQISIICENDIAARIQYRQRHAKEARKLIPEALSAVIRMKGGAPLEILIIGIYSGQYQTVLNARDLTDFVPIRDTEAVLLSVAAGIPIYIEANLMTMQSVSYKKGEQGIPLPTNTLSLDMLRKALEHAVESENYELASHLRDEIRKRDNNENKP